MLLFDQVYFLALMILSFFITYNGSYTEYSRNSTKSVEETAALETMRPVVSICRYKEGTR